MQKANVDQQLSELNLKNIKEKVTTKMRRIRQKDFIHSQPEIRCLQKCTIVF